MEPGLSKSQAGCKYTSLFFFLPWAVGVELQCSGLTSTIRGQKGSSCTSEPVLCGIGLLQLSGQLGGACLGAQLLDLLFYI